MNDLALERAAVELFEELYELPAEARAARLHAATKDWPELREQVEALLAAHQSESLQTGGAGALLEDEAPPERIGAYRIAWSAYLGYGLASGLPDRAADAEDFLALAVRTSERLVALESKDSALQAFRANVSQITSQELAEEGHREEAVAMQREVIAMFERALAAERKPATANRLASAQVTMGHIGILLGDRALACDSFRAARRQIADLEDRGELLGTVEEQGKVAARNVAACANGGALETPA